MKTRLVAFLRAVMPTGPNRIPSMRALAEILGDSGYGNVRTYIQSGNIILDSPHSPHDAALDIHRLIRERIGADLAVIVKSPEQLSRAVSESPFAGETDKSCVFLVLSNDEPDAGLLEELKNTDWGAQRLFVGKECIHLLLPWMARPKRLSNTFLERKLGIRSTMRNLAVAQKIESMCKEVVE